MATVIGRTSVNILDMVNEAVVYGEITEEGRLLLTTKGGVVMDLGPVGGGGTTSGTKTIRFNFATPVTTWTCVHNRNKETVDVTTFDINGDEIFGDVSVVDENTIQIVWYHAVSGVAVVQSD